MVFFNFFIIFLIIFYFILIIKIVLHIFIKKNKLPFFKIWLLIFFIFPLLGFLFYFIFGELKFTKSYINKSNFIWKLTLRWLNILIIKNFWNCSAKNNITDSIFQLCQNNPNIYSVTGNKIKILTNYKNIINNIIKDIENAKKSIEMIFYIWFPGGMADKIAKSLIKASKRGIDCRLILDSAGSKVFFRSKWVKIMSNSGIKIIESLKINFLYFFLRRMDLRQHRKIIIIDNIIAYTGSMNLIDPSVFKKESHIGKWIDIMVRIKGPLTIILGSIFSYDWAIETGVLIFPNISKSIFFSLKKDLPVIQTIVSGPNFSENTIHQILLSSIYSARKKLTITTPYFVPSDDLLEAICNAANRGVDVNLILPLNTDSVLVHWASRSFFDELLLAGVKIYLFKKGLLHTKSIYIDGSISLIGTVNLDIRSLWLNFEITLIIESNGFSKDLYKIQNSYIKYSKLLDSKSWFNRRYTNRFLEKTCCLFRPFL